MKEMRINILKQINEIEAKHCVGCQLKFAKGNKQKACNSFCEIGREIAEIGSGLIKKEKSDKTIPIDIIYSKRGEEREKAIIKLIENGYRGSEIARETGINRNTIYGIIHRNKKKCKGGA